MSILFDLKNYTDFFHDGSISKLIHEKKTLKIYMESAEIDEDDLTPNILTLSDNRIKGCLHIENVNKIFLNNTPFKGILEKKFDYGGIFEFILSDNTVQISIDWRNYAPTFETIEFSIIKIDAQNIWWENMTNI